VDDRPPPPIDVRRVVVLGVLAVLLVVALTVLVRPFIFVFAPERTDANVVVAAVADANREPTVRTLLLNELHGLPGEVRVEEHVRVQVIVAPRLGGGFAVLAAWSPANDCAVSIAEDRLVDCAGASWTVEGAPIDPGGGPLVSFPVTVSEGAIVVDFTAPHARAAG